MTTAKQQEARARIIAQASQVDWGAMSAEQFGTWVDGLPLDEFFALLDLHAAGNSEASEAIEEQPTPPVPSLPPDDNGWTIYTGEGVTPVPDDEQLYVLFPDGAVCGPNRADAFLWGSDGSASIVAYQAAVLVN